MSKVFALVMALMVTVGCGSGAYVRPSAGCKCAEMMGAGACKCNHCSRESGAKCYCGDHGCKCGATMPKCQCGHCTGKSGGDDGKGGCDCANEHK